MYNPKQTPWMNVYLPRSGLDPAGTGSRAQENVRPREFTEGLGDLENSDIAIWSSPGEIEAEDSVELENFEPIASYNWLDTPVPTIAVPGSPPIWNFSSPLKVDKDWAPVYVDINSHKLPSSPFTPLMLAVQHMKPSFDFSEIDIITDRNNLRKLAGWAAGDAINGFRIDVELVGKTLLLSRWEPITRSEKPGMGYAVQFLKAATQNPPLCEQSEEHHRINKMRFAGLDMLVRCTAHACLQPANAQVHRVSVEEKGILSQLDALTLSPPETARVSSVPPSSRSGKSLVSVVPAGSLVPQSSLIHLKTRSVRQSRDDVFDWPAAITQLYFAGNPRLYLGIHTKGLFQSIETHPLTNSLPEDNSEWIKFSAEAGYRTLGGFLKVLKQLVVRHCEQLALGEESPQLFSLLSNKNELRLHTRSTGVSLDTELRHVFLTSLRSH